MADERSLWDTTGITIVNDLDLNTSTLYATTGEAIPAGERMTARVDDGKLYRATGTDIWFGHAKRDYAQGERVTLWPPVDWTR